jgi:hypothetical protein
MLCPVIFAVIQSSRLDSSVKVWIPPLSGGCLLEKILLNKILSQPNTIYELNNSYPATSFGFLPSHNQATTVHIFLFPNYVDWYRMSNWQVLAIILMMTWKGVETAEHKCIN